MAAMTLLAVIALALSIRSSQRHKDEKREIFNAALASRDEWLKAGERIGAENRDKVWRRTPIYTMAIDDLLRQASEQQIERTLELGR